LTVMKSAPQVRAVRAASSCLPVGGHTLLLVSRLLALLGRLLLLGLVRVELLGLAESLALGRCESLVGVLRLNLALRREVALVPALGGSIPAAALSIALVALAVMRLVASARAVALVAAHASLVVPAAAAEPAPSWAAGGRLVGGSVDADRATVEFDVVHGLDGVLGFGVLGEAHEAKAAAAASIAVLDHDGLFHLAEFLKLGSERYIIRVPREAANEDFRHGEKDGKREAKDDDGRRAAARERK